VSKIKTGLVALFAFVGVSLSAGAAKAADYLCTADYTPLDTFGAGTEGYVRFTTYTGPDCSGSFSGTWFLCTGGATSSVCIQNTSFHYTNAEILEMASATREAALWNMRATVFGNVCIGGSGFCVGHLEFRAN